MALDNVTSHFSTVLELIASASFLSSLSIINGCTNKYQKKDKIWFVAVYWSRVEKTEIRTEFATKS